MDARQTKKGNFNLCDEHVIMQGEVKPDSVVNGSDALSDEQVLTQREVKPEEVDLTEVDSAVNGSDPLGEMQEEIMDSEEDWFVVEDLDMDSDDDSFEDEGDIDEHDDGAGSDIDESEDHGEPGDENGLEIVRGKKWVGKIEVVDLTTN